MYEYAVIYAGHSEVVWSRTPYQGVQLTGLPAGVDVQVLVRTIDGVGLRSTPASGTAYAQSAATVDTDFDAIRRRFALDVLERDVVAAAEAITLRAAEASVFRKRLRSLNKLVRRGSILAIIGDALISPDATGCDNNHLLNLGKASNILVADVITRAARAGLGPHPAAFRTLGRAREAQARTVDRARRLPKTGDCAGPPRVALKVAAHNTLTLDAAELRLEEQEVLEDYFNRNRDRDTKETQFGFRSRTEARLAYRECRKLRSQNECESLAAIFPGTDTPAITDHDYDAINAPNPAQRKSPRLHWVAEHDRARKGWYSRLPPCVGATEIASGNQCDEYPFRTTREGGPGPPRASLRIVPTPQNRKQGEHLNRFYGLCGLRRPDRAFLVVPLRPALETSTRYACNPRP